MIIEKTVPKFDSVKEEAAFWDSHSVSDYWKEEDTTLVYVPESEKKETMTLRIAPSLKKDVEGVARKYDISTSSLIRMWVVDKLREYKEA